MIDRNRPNAGMRRWIASARAGSAGKGDNPVIVDLKPLLPSGHPVAVTQFESRSYDDGLRAGAQARLRSTPITPYQRVGLDQFARGFRAGYFSSRARAAQALDLPPGQALF
jgi:hypothetical protein